MKPIRIFLLLFVVFLFFGLGTLLLPNSDIRIMGDLGIRFPSLKGVFQDRKVNYANIASILQQKRADTDSLVRVVRKDTLIKSDTLVVRLVSQPLEYPENDKTILYPFFRQLGEANNQKGIHILHYGDSQLEGDRITDYLRSRFQAEFGGSGPGLLPIGEEGYRLAMLSSVSGNWQKHNLMGTKASNQGSHPYGPMGSYYNFESEKKDSLQESEKPREAWITLNGKPDSKADQYHRCLIFYENKNAVGVSFFNGDVKLKSDSLQKNRSLGVYETTFTETPKNLTIKFKGDESPDFYGICLDNYSGISVDNIPIRGSSGLEFARMNPSVLSEIYRILNVKLLILQFGANVVPGDLDDYSYYENGLYAQICQLKRLNPGLTIIVIGLSDASKKNGESYESYACVEKILKAQKNAAFKSGCVFWNLYAAMGGKNSMPSWVFAKEPLATTDFIHFNYSGARIVGKMLYSALISDYNEFIQEHSQ